MNKELQGLFLCVAALGFAYTALMLLLMLISGIKLFKTVSLVFALSILFFSFGLSKQVKLRMKEKLRQIMPFHNHRSPAS